MKRITVAKLTGLAALAAALAGCNDMGIAMAPPTQVTRAPGVPIAVDSVAGAPASVSGAFNSALSSEASARSIEIVDPKTNPRFRVRGYLAAEPTSDGQTALAFVWDVFDSSKQRAQRVQGATVARSSSGDWSGVDQSTVTKAASESMDQIAQFLAVQPARPAGTATRTAAVAPARR